jgi:hypothetical protein
LLVETAQGFRGSDPATGRRSKVFLLTVNVGRHAFGRLEPARIDPVSCVEGLRGQLSPRPENLIPVHPARLASAAESYDDSGGVSSSLLEMDPVDFEDLVATLQQHSPAGSGPGSLRHAAAQGRHEGNPGHDRRPGTKRAGIRRGEAADADRRQPAH